MSYATEAPVSIAEQRALPRMLPKARPGVENRTCFRKTSQIGLSDYMNRLSPTMNLGSLLKRTSMIRMRNLGVELMAGAVRKKTPQEALAGGISTHQFGPCRRICFRMKVNCRRHSMSLEISVISCDFESA